MHPAVKVRGEQPGGFDGAVARRGIVDVVVVNNDGLETKGFALLPGTHDSLHVHGGGGNNLGVAEDNWSEPRGVDSVVVDQMPWDDSGVFHN